MGRPRRALGETVFAITAAAVHTACRGRRRAADTVDGAAARPDQPARGIDDGADTWRNEPYHVQRGVDGGLLVDVAADGPDQGDRRQRHKERRGRPEPDHGKPRPEDVPNPGGGWTSSVFVPSRQVDVIAERCAAILSGSWKVNNNNKKGG